MRRVAARAQVFLRAAEYVGAALMVLGSTACGDKDHPPALADMNPRPRDDGGNTMPGDDAGTEDGESNADAGGSPDGGSGGPDPRPLFTKCWNDVMTQGGVAADPWFCFATTEGHPAHTTIVRNLLYPAIGFDIRLDPADHTLEVIMSGSWDMKITAPTARLLSVGGVSTDDNDGSALHFDWDYGECPGGNDRGKFQIWSIAWDASNKLTKGEVDFEHHCGDSPPAYGRFRLNSKRPP